MSPPFRKIRGMILSPRCWRSDAVPEFWNRPAIPILSNNAAGKVHYHMFRSTLLAGMWLVLSSLSLRAGNGFQDDQGGYLPMMCSHYRHVITAGIDNYGRDTNGLWLAAMDINQGGQPANSRRKLFHIFIPNPPACSAPIPVRIAAMPLTAWAFCFSLWSAWKPEKNPTGWVLAGDFREWLWEFNRQWVVMTVLTQPVSITTPPLAQAVSFLPRSLPQWASLSLTLLCPGTNWPIILRENNYLLIPDHYLYHAAHSDLRACPAVFAEVCANLARMVWLPVLICDPAGCATGELPETVFRWW